MKYYFFSLLFFSHSFLVAMEQGPAREALIAHLKEQYASDDLQGIPMPENAYELMDQWCEQQTPSVRFNLWIKSRDTGKNPPVDKLSLIDLLHVEKLYANSATTKPVPLPISEALNNERRVIWEALNRQRPNVANVSGDVVLEMETQAPQNQCQDKPDSIELDQEEAGCSCNCFKALFASVKKKDPTKNL